MLCGYDLAVLPGYPSHLAADFHRMPSVLRGGDVLKLGAVMDSGDAGIIRTVADTDVDRPAAAGDLHLCAGLLHNGFRLSFRGDLLTDIVIGNGGHQRGMGLIAVLASCFSPAFFWKDFTAVSVLLP